MLTTPKTDGKKSFKNMARGGIRTVKKILSFSLIERVILSAGAMLIFSVSFQIRPNARRRLSWNILQYIYQVFFRNLEMFLLISPMAFHSLLYLASLALKAQANHA